jgi:hypothetical protein
MQAIGSTFEETPFARARPPGQGLRALLLWSAAFVLAAGLEARLAVSPPAAPSLLLSRAAPANPYGALVDRALFADLAPASPSKRSFALALAARPYGALVDPGFSDADLAARQSSDQTRFAAALAIAAARPARAPARPYGSLAEFLADATTVPPLLAPPLRTSLDLAEPAAEPGEAPTPPRREVASLEDAPLPPTRPADLALLAPPERRAPPRAASAPPAPETAVADNRNLFEKLFGVGGAPETATAYAAPESPGPVGRGAPAANDNVSGWSIFGRSEPPAGYDRFTAVYDISARTVYMPDGTRLEAHSGLGDRLDDPRFVSERMRGATPPHLYALEPREEMFHGVPALRLTPIGEGEMFGRAGLLAHTYMLGPNGDSNGCVSFKDYEAFLRAFREGQVRRLAVVAKL